MKKSKLATPDWIKEGYDSPEAYAKAKGIKGKKKEEKTFKVRKCPECGSYDVSVVLSGNDSGDVEDEDAIPEGKATGEWVCKKCKWKGKDVEEEELTEDEFMKYLDEKGEEVA
jgi:ribosomal protein L37AE/L43A